MESEACRSSGGPFVSLAWNATPGSKAISVVIFTVLLFNLPLSIILYPLAKLCDRKDSDTHARARAKAVSEAIDEQSAAMNKREIHRVRLLTLRHEPAAFEARFLARKRSRGDSADTLQVPSNVTPEDQVARQQALAMKLEGKIADLTTTIDGLTTVLEKLPEQLTRTEKMSNMLSTGEMGRQMRARWLVFGGIAVLSVISVAPIVFGPLAIQAHVYCSVKSPPSESLRGGYWIIYSVASVLPAVLAWGQVLRAAWHWKHGRCADCCEDRSAVQLEADGFDAASIDERMRKLSSTLGSSASDESSPISPKSPIFPVGSLPRIEEGQTVNFSRPRSQWRGSLGETGPGVDVHII